MSGHAALGHAHDALIVPDTATTDELAAKHYWGSRCQYTALPAAMLQHAYCNMHDVDPRI